ncbi:hypothetical protein [Caulobacter sp. 17J80-11]|uniref:hypothetical protein n=1 Tax=Caulobacter sp. 17J80-11 TaxID=2763502 RepID=UPI001653798F|nr:hypothetical protein [Caulobacter sp. 17J80-11]MBC6982811.1 hypothetical protein [Caulobacter sp. 17J80-11]
MRAALAAVAAVFALAAPPVAAATETAQSAITYTTAPAADPDLEIPRAQAALLRTIWKLQSGAPDYGAMERKLADTVKAQPDLVEQVKAYGPAEDVEYLGAVDGARHFKVAFKGVETHWFIALSPAGKIAALVFREG